jgi:O-antigen ligase
LRLFVDESSLLFAGAHNGYVQLLLSAGAVGVSMFVLVMMWAVVQGVIRLQSAGSSELSSRLRLAVAIVGSHIVYSTGYTLPNEQGLLLAMAIQLISPPQRVSAKTLLAHKELSQAQWQTRGLYRRQAADRTGS